MVQDSENCGISCGGVVIRWQVRKGEFLVRVKKGGVVGWKGTARSYAAEALEGNKRVERDGGGVT